MALEIKKVGSDEYGLHIKALVVGEPGSGKTRFSSCWPDPLFVSAEGGLMSVADRGVHAVEVGDVQTLREVLQALKQSPEVQEQQLGFAPRTVVLDTLDEIARISTKERNVQKNQESLKRDDWNWLGDHMRGITRVFRNLPMNVVVTCHIKQVTDEETGGTWFKPQLQGAFGDEVSGYFDIAGVLRARNRVELEDGNKVQYVDRYLQTYPDARHPWIKDRSGKLPMEFPVNFNDDYQRMHDAIYGDLSLPETTVSSTEPEPAPVEDLELQQEEAA